MEKLSIDKAKKTTTMFLVNPEFEEYYANLINKRKETYEKNILSLVSVDALKDFIKNNEGAIQMVQTLIGISSEKFKRVISYVRMSLGYLVETEWSDAQLRSEMILRPQLMDEVCQLLYNGKNIDKYKKHIPAFILDSFCIDTNFIASNANQSTLLSKLKDKVSTEYNSRYCAYYERTLIDTISKMCQSLGLDFEENIEVPGLNSLLTTQRAMSLKGIKYDNKVLLVQYNYFTTTSSSQTSYYNDFIRILYQYCGDHKNVRMVNCLDGAGWIARSADYYKVYNDCHYFINLNNLSIFKEIIADFFQVD